MEAGRATRRPAGTGEPRRQRGEPTDGLAEKEVFVCRKTTGREEPKTKETEEVDRGQRNQTGQWQGEGGKPGNLLDANRRVLRKEVLDERFKFEVFSLNFSR